MLDLPNLRGYLGSPDCIDKQYDFYLPFKEFDEKQNNIEAAKEYVEKLFIKL